MIPSVTTEEASDDGCRMPWRVVGRYERDRSINSAVDEEGRSSSSFVGAEQFRHAIRSVMKVVNTAS